MSEERKISAVIITYNEENNIKRCLTSLKDIADEIIVVDSFSTDKTEAICAEFGVRFVKHKFDGHIEQKNWAREQASHNIVLSLDADEALDNRLQDSILAVKKNWQYDAYKMNRLTNYCGKWIRHTGWYPDTKLRLWDNTKGHWTGENPHDEFKLFDESSNVTLLYGDILHYSYYTIEDHLKQVDYFTDINSRVAFEKGKKSSHFKIFYKSWFKFFRDFVLKRGFLDGYSGFLISKISAKATAMKYQKLLALNKGK